MTGEGDGRRGIVEVLHSLCVCVCVCVSFAGLGFGLHPDDDAAGVVEEGFDV